MLNDEPNNHPAERIRGTSSTDPALSAILVTSDKYQNIRLTVDHLKAQTLAEQMEIIFVVPSIERLELDESELVCFHGWHTVEIGQVRSIGYSFAAGIQHARAPIVALTEDHAFPDIKWAELLTGAHQQEWAVVGPSMTNGNPDSLVSWADFYQAYGEWAYPVLSGPVRHLPGHNSSYKRDILLSLGDSLTVLMESEEILQSHLKAEGYGLYLESATCTAHVNFNSLTSWIPARYYKGRQFASTWAHNWRLPRRLLYAAASPLIPFIRTWRIQKNVRRGMSLNFLFCLLPVLFLGMAVDGLGQMLGYAAGPGNAIDRVAMYEYDRIERKE